MRANLGNIDRIVRLLIGLAAVALLFTGPFAAGGGWGIVQYVLVGAAVILVATSAIKFCPAYRLFGVRTCKID